MRYVQPNLNKYFFFELLFSYQQIIRPNGSQCHSGANQRNEQNAIDGENRCGHSLLEFDDPMRFRRVPIQRVIGHRIEPNECEENDRRPLEHAIYSEREKTAAANVAR